ncbi:Atrial natriuretic peptide receptor 1 [Hypsibius exemplaris]|uniref:guanylate cyclase n=1 Tax=Hypsibius exemplaris TaxID=2072580 RepID=A0A1W0WZ54_HYPEX|nr:Atrial natriuretic peptide receptor 1 [Hypsibius exemplaris]
MFAAFFGQHTAEAAGMVTSEYVYVAVILFPRFGRFQWSNRYGNITTNGLESLLRLSLQPPTGSTFDEFERQVKQRSPKFGYSYAPQERVDMIVGHFYDAIVMYGNLLAQLHAAGFSITDTAQAAHMTQNCMSFYSPIYGHITLDANGDRLNAYQMTKFDVLTGRFEPFVNFPNVRGVTLRVTGPSRWRGRDHLPPNEPLCGFRGDFSVCHKNDASLGAMEVAVATTVPILFLSFGIIGAFIAGKRYVKKHWDPDWWRVYLHCLEDTGESPRNSNSRNSKSDVIAGEGKPGQVPKPRIHVPCPHAMMATYRGGMVTLVELPDPKQRASPAIGKAMTPLRKMLHPNILTFVGIAVTDEDICTYLIGDGCSQKSTLEAMLRLDVHHLDNPLKFSLINDLVTGLVYIHASPLRSHGSLTDTTCLINNRFVLKLVGHGLGGFRSPDELAVPEEHQIHRNWRPLLWRAPELLRKTMTPAGTPKGDVYSFSILVQEIMLVLPPFGTNHQSWAMTNLDIKDVVMEVKHRTFPPNRPRVSQSSCPVFLCNLMEDCWQENPALRPPFTRIENELRRAEVFSRKDIIEHLIGRLDVYAQTLESTIEETVQSFMEEKRRGEQVLFSILPKFVAQLLVSGTAVLPQIHNSSTIHMSHLDGWDNIVAVTHNPRELTHALNTFYAICDAVIEKYDAFKVETIIDSNLVVSGLPASNGTRHVAVIAHMSLELLAAIRGRSLTTSIPTSCLLRVGINSGPCVSGVIGYTLPKYCL